jgi:hypothetical protein
LLKEENNVGAVQHPDEVKTANIAPYPLKISRDRVTEENAAVQFSPIIPS